MRVDRYFYRPTQYYLVGATRQSSQRRRPDDRVMPATATTVSSRVASATWLAVITAGQRTTTPVTAQVTHRPSSPAGMPYRIGDAMPVTAPSRSG